ncbi:MAG TPA: DUF4142 domain-containing protein [Longimicrobiaceae bacterium]|nr:DUF4142 domain-containing protein [Longimicrobiaceae bacterium]
MKAKQAAVSVFAVLVLWGCGKAKSDASAMADTTAAAPAEVAPAESSAAPAAAGPSDAQIAAIVVTANSADSTAGELALKKSTNPKVKDFAQRMVTDHGAVNKMAVALAQQLNLTPEPSPTSQALAQDGEQNIQKLQGLSGSAFDKAYIDHEVALHEQVLDALDHTLLPSAQNPQLKDLLQKGRPIFEGHLEMAKQIQSSLGNS